MVIIHMYYLQHTKFQHESPGHNVGVAAIGRVPPSHHLTFQRHGRKSS